MFIKRKTMYFVEVIDQTGCINLIPKFKFSEHERVHYLNTKKFAIFTDKIWIIKYIIYHHITNKIVKCSSTIIKK